MSITAKTEHAAEGFSFDLDAVRARFADSHEPVVSSCGGKLAIPVQDEDDSWTLCVNGDAWEARFERVWHHRFLPDGRLMALVKADDQWTIAIDGKPWTESFEFVWTPKLSPDGKRIAAQIKRDDQYSIIVDGKTWEENFLSIREFCVADDGSVGATAQLDPLKEADIETFEKGVWGAVRDGKPWGNRFLNAYTPAIGPDGRLSLQARTARLSYTVAEDGKCWDTPFACTWEQIPHPKDGWIAAPGLKDGAWSLYKKEGPLWTMRSQQLWHPVFSPDGARLAAAVSPEFGRWTVAVDDVRWAEDFGDCVLKPLFSPDGSRVGAVVKDAGTWTVAVDGRPWPGRWEMAWDPVFSPGSEHAAAKVEREGRYCVALDGKLLGTWFDGLWEPAFSEDGTSLRVNVLEGGTYSSRLVRLEEFSG